MQLLAQIMDFLVELAELGGDEDYDTEEDDDHKRSGFAEDPEDLLGGSFVPEVALGLRVFFHLETFVLHASN